MEEPTAFTDLGIPCIVNIFSRLSPSECAAAACVSQLWAQVAAEDALWRHHLAADFATASCSCHDGSDAGSYKLAYTSWRQQYADVYGPMLSRSLAAWSRIKAWLKAHSPRILDSLNPGAEPQEVAAAEATLGHPLPTAMRVIYRVHNGQTLVLAQQSCEEGPPADLLMGLFGTTAFYDHVTSTQLLPLDKAAMLTRLLRSRRPLGAGQTMLSGSEVTFAHSFRVYDKLCVVDSNTGAVALKLPHRDWPMAPPKDTHPEAFDGLLRWFEEYAARLSGGMYSTCAGESSLAEAGLHESEAISLFPQTYPHAATAITRGVKVTWSSLLVPQESRQGRLMFAYSVRYSLLTQQQQQEVLAQLAAQEQAWEQQQQQVAAAAAAKAAGEGHANGSSSDGSTAAGGDTADAAPAGPSGQQQQQQHDGRTGAGVHQRPSGSVPAAGDGAGSSSGSLKPYRQGFVLGPCAASAGPAAVPPTLAKAAPWKQAAATAAAAGRGSNSGSGGGGAAAVNSNSAAAASATDGLGGTPTSCQLESRHWVIYNPQGSELDRVDGEGVVGLYPLLYPGQATPFAYASCTPCPIPETAREAAAEGVGTSAGADAGGLDDTGEAGQQEQQGVGGRAASSSSRWQTGSGRLAGCVAGCMEGSFSFVGGSLMQRSGESFEVACPRLLFAVPEYLF